MILNSFFELFYINKTVRDKYSRNDKKFSIITELGMKNWLVHTADNYFFSVLREE